MSQLTWNQLLTCDNQTSKDIQTVQIIQTNQTTQIIKTIQTIHAYHITHLMSQMSQLTGNQPLTQYVIHFLKITLHQDHNGTVMLTIMHVT